nr:DNA-directed DNA polymerase [Tanacetum cinerariifolium]
MNKRCSAILRNKLLLKEKDRGSFTIPCDIGQLHIDNALVDLGASISLMPYTMYEMLGLGELKPTRISLKLTDRSIQYPRGITENVLIKVDKFVLPIDFVILDILEDSKVPILLGQPFLATARAMIDVFIKKIMLRVGDDEVIFEIDQSIKRQPDEDDECYGINDLDYIINEETHELLADSSLMKGLEKLIGQLDPEFCNSLKLDVRESKHVYSVSANEIDEKKQELKDLPSHLEYAYLHGDKSFPIIISSKLYKKEKKLLLEVLEKRKGAIAWKMSDIKGISPSYWTHKILIEEEFKPVIQPQRHLNPKVQDVVNNEIVKLLESGLIYPISDSPWVSPIHVVPKKGGMTVVLNDNNEIIPSRTVTGWRVCIDYHKLNDATRKDHSLFPLLIKYQENTTFTSPYGNFAYRQMPFGLCNTLATFQRYMTAIFHDMVENFMEVFMDDFSVFDNSFDCFLTNLDRMLARGENLAANHLSRPKSPYLDTFTEDEIVDEFLDEHLMILKADDEPWYVDYVNYIVGRILPPNWTPKKQRRDRETYHQEVRCVKTIFRTAYKTPTRCTPFRLVYRKSCHLPVEIEHKAYWELKQCDMDLTVTAKNRFMELNELMELRDKAYENTRIYKERTKRWHDPRLRGDKDFKVGDKVLLFNSRLKMHPGKIKSRLYDRMW